jgi:hypothetical protein
MFDGFEQASNVVSEVGSQSFRELVSGGRGGGATNTPDYRLYAAVESHSIALLMAFTKRTDAAEEAYWKLRNYTTDRAEGHSVKYAVDAIKERQPRSPARTSDKNAEESVNEADVLVRLFRIPRSWLQRSTNDHSYFVVDGPFVWMYDGVTVQKCDARELQADFRKKLDQVTEEVKKAGRLAAHDYYAEIKRLLKERYDIDWRSPLELNPGMHIDF